MSRVGGERAPMSEGEGCHRRGTVRKGWFDRDGKPGALNGACWFPGFCAHKSSQRSHSPLSAWRLRHYSYIMGGHYLCRLCVQQGPHEGGGGERQHDYDLSRRTAPHRPHHAAAHMQGSSFPYSRVTPRGDITTKRRRAQSRH